MFVSDVLIETWGPQEWGALAGVVFGFAGFIIAIVALGHSKESNRIADRALNAQIADGELRLNVELDLRDYATRMCKARVTIRNLSRFAVTIDRLEWRALGGDVAWKGLGRYTSEPHRGYPATLEPRTSVTTEFNEISIESDEFLYRIESLVAVTQCGHEVRPNPEQWIRKVSEYQALTRRPARSS